MRVCPECLELFPDDSTFCPFDGKRLEKPSDPWIGRILDGKYQISCRIGEGGMGQVYRALQYHPERQVAVKILPAGSLKDPAMRERFSREGMAVAMIQHEHIVAVYDAGESEDAVPYLVMELLDGESLADLARLGPLPVPRALGIMLQICEALGPVHALGIIHRDLKPGNIFIARADGGGDCVKILDFGIALLAEKPRLTDKDLVLGTPEYISPEQVLGMEIGPPTDLYALGCIGYEMLTGKLPFGETSPTQLFVKHVNEKPRDILKVAPGLPPGLCTIIMRLLEKDPGKRHADAYVLMNELRALGLTGKEQERTTVKGRPAVAVDADTAPAGLHRKWQTFLNSTKNRAHEIQDAVALIAEMERLTARLGEIENEQKGLGSEIDVIDLGAADARTRFRRALEELARELSGRRSRYLSIAIELAEMDAMTVSLEEGLRDIIDEASADAGDRLTYGLVAQCAKLGTAAGEWLELYEKLQGIEPVRDRLFSELADLEYQIQQLRKRMESIDAEAGEKKRKYEERLAVLASEKQDIKKRLGVISTLFAKEVA